MYRSLIVLIVLLISGAFALIYYPGDCPQVEPMPGFNMDKMLGVWYVIQRSTTSSHRITYNFSRTMVPGKYQFKQTAIHYFKGFVPFERQNHETGILTVPKASEPGRMKVWFPLSIAMYTVMNTDYTSFADVFTCKQLLFRHLRVATVLFRAHDNRSSDIF